MKFYKVNLLSEKTEFNSLIDHRTYPTAEIACPKCRNKVSVTFNDLEKHQFSTFSNLSDQEQLNFENYIKTSGIEVSNSFLDYYCPECKTPIRLLYNSWAGGKHTEHGFYLNAIVSN